ncbi:hypothetical protein GTQ99_23850, partial [Kineococcus sp. T13]|uniref:hypothetical protein n=1 Tax=Kineococcus vitellinus TaxID=2696565 RepID=UPI001412081E
VVGALVVDPGLLGEQAHEAAQLRRFVRLFAQQSGIDDERADDLVQATAELLSAGEDGRRATAVELREDRREVTVVVDLVDLVDLADLERVRVPPAADALLSGLSRDWGWRRTDGALQLWCALDARGSAS